MRHCHMADGKALRWATVIVTKKKEVFYSICMYNQLQCFPSVMIMFTFHQNKDFL